MPPVVRTIIVLGVAALVAMQVLLNALIADPSTRMTIAPSLWPGHPTVLTNWTMAEIGAHAARGQKPPRETLRQVERISNKAPLAVEPFLVEGALAQV